MPAHQNFIVVIPRSWQRVRKVLTVLQPLIEEWLGPVETMMVLDLAAGSEKDRLEAVSALDSLPEMADHEIVVLYPADHARRGCVHVDRQGGFDVVNLSLVDHTAAAERLERIWQLIGAEASAALTGEELEGSDVQTEALQDSGVLPADLDLCDIAIVGPAPHAPAPDGHAKLPHGGRWLRRT
jgi:hypothetical protein